MMRVVGPPVPKSHTNTLPDNWFDQRVDHFNNSDTRTFKQRYFLNDKYYKTGGPVFLLVDGENEGQDYFITKGAVSEYAKQFNALLVDLEHRYYGHSVPTPDLSVDNLRYLTVGQALKDTEQFIGYLNKKLALNTNNTKWIAFGGSYAGNLVAFLREKYPHAVAGSVASSAPVQMTYDFNQYFTGAGKSMGTECSNQIREAVRLVEDQLKTPEGWLAIEKELKLCKPLNGTDISSVNTMMISAAIPFVMAAQYVGQSGIDMVCAVMTNTKDGSTPIQRFTKVLTQFSKAKCLDNDYNQFIDDIRQTSKTAPMNQIGYRQWLWQTCTEFGYFQTTDHTDSPFGNQVSIDFYVKRCADMYGKQFTGQFIRKGIDKFNQYYGGAKPNVTNVVFPNGSTDPWRVLSVLKDLNTSSRALMIQGCGHGSDMQETLSTDPRQLTDARLAIAKQIQLFLK
ncbi:putative serine protease K12H4.7 [Oppia nitens]|uniref:putative serine protease K12H4.7 n=1 Tax=Oppia nitens TaxID=1686743 RepID=UPI0023DC26AC|nr:putative serine protease K12H4.7 [Oppia nitens]